MKKRLGLFVIVVVASCLAGAASSSWAQSGADKPAPPQEKEKPAAADAIGGDWEGLVELPDGSTPFTMKLTVEKDKVTGEVAGPQGATTISEGAWVEGTLTIAFTYVDGASIVMTGSVVDGQLAGSLDYGGGQMVVSWAAKKTPAK